MSSFEKWVKENNKFIWSIVENKNRMYFSNNFYRLTLRYHDKEDLYQELLMKFYEVFDTYDKNNQAIRLTYMGVIGKNHIMTLMQPYKYKKNTVNITTKYNLDNIIDDIDYEQLYINKITMQSIIKLADEYKQGNIIKLILKGYTQSDIALDLNVSRQYINQIYLAFIEKMKEELL
jgi:RNA polymerase sigma factor (sigma-70 family)